MLNLRSESALSGGVILHPWREHALSVGVDTARAALSVSTPTDRACSRRGSEKFKSYNHYSKNRLSRIFFIETRIEQLLSPWV